MDVMGEIKASKGMQFDLDDNMYERICIEGLPDKSLGGYIYLMVEEAEKLIESVEAALKDINRIIFE